MSDENQGDLTEAETTELSSLRAEMADTMGANFDGHWGSQYWNNTAKQGRAQELLARESGDGGAEPAQGGADQAMTEADVSGSLDALAAMGEVGSEFANEIRHNGATPALETIESVRTDILGDMGITADEVASAFDGLNDNCRAAVFKEFSSAYTPQLPAADRADLKEFSQSSAGQILVPEWGDDAGRKLATALFRWQRTIEGLSPSEFAELDDFYRLRLRPQERAAVLRRLAA